MNCNEIRGAMFWLGWVAVMTVLAVPASVEAQSLQYCGLVGGPQRPTGVDSTGGWWRVGSGPSLENIRFIQGDPTGWHVYEASSPSEVTADIPPLDTDTIRVINGQREDGSNAPGSCGGACMRWPEGIVGYNDSNPQIVYGYYVEERPVCASPAGFEFVHALIGQMKSVDGGLTWFDQGVVLDAPGGDQCVTTGNYQMVGGVGDPGVIRLNGYVYIVATNYAGGGDSDNDKANQGFLIARMDWNDRDNPVGAFKWFNSSSGLYDIQAVDTSADPSIVPVTTFVDNVRPITIFSNARSWRSGNGVRPYGNYTEGSLHYNTALGKIMFVASKLYSGERYWLLGGHYAAYLDLAAIVTNPVNGWLAFYDPINATQSHSTTAPTPVLEYSGLYPEESTDGYPRFVGMGSNDDDKSSTGTSVLFFTGNDGNEALLSAADETLTCTATAVADIGPVQPAPHLGIEGKILHLQHDLAWARYRNRGLLQAEVTQLDATSRPGR